MPLILAIPFYMAIAAYMAAAAMSIAHIRGVGDSILLNAKRAAAAGNTLLLLVFIIRWAQWGRPPFTGMGDSLNLFLILSTGIILTVQRQDALRPLMCFYFPALAVLAGLTAIIAPKYLVEGPRELNSLLLTIHVGLVFLAFALFFVASLTSVAYTFKAQHLKRHQTTGFFQKLPSLEQLDTTLFRLIGAGYPVFAITLVLGLLWAWAQRDSLGAYWFISPKVVFAVVMVLFYATSFHVRRFGLLRGPKLAYVVFVGFTILLATYLVLGLMGRFGAYFSGAVS